MPYEYETLVGHVMMVNGRSISAPPPGALVQVAPRKAARGREADAFYALILPAGQTTAPAVFYEGMAGTAAETYYASSGSVTAGLRATLEDLHRHLTEHNRGGGRRYEASAIIGVLRGGDLYLAKAGVGAALIRYRDEVIVFPAPLETPGALDGVPLGSERDLDLKLSRYLIGASARLLLADRAIADTDGAALRAALATGDFAETLVALKAASPPHLSVSLIEFVTPQAAIALPVREAVSTAEPNPAPAAAAAPPPAPPAANAPPTPAPLRVSESERALGKAAGGAGGVLAYLGGLLDRWFPPPGERRGWLGSPAAAGLTLLIPVAIVALVLALWLSGTGESEFDLCVERANQAVTLARSIDSADVNGTLAAWNAGLAVVQECDNLRAGDPMLAVLTREGQTMVDRLLRVSRREVSPLEVFTNAEIEGLILQGSDLYVLDSRNQYVYRAALAQEDGLSVVQGTRQVIPSMRRGGVVSGITVGDIIDIAWSDESGGLGQGNVIVAMDSTGLLVSCPPRFLQNCVPQRLPGTEAWGAPTAITFWQGRLYVLDPTANQVWRYDPAGGAYPNSPVDYFSGTARPDIRGAVDMSIDSEGFVYLLLADGRLGRFRSGDPVNFGYANFPDDSPPTTADALYLNTNPVAQGLYIVDQANRTIYETTLAGTFINSYRTYDEDMFTGIRDVAFDTNLGVIYIASGNTVFAMRRSGDAP